MVCTVDTDVVVIIISKFHHLQSLCPNVTIWIAFGAGKNLFYYCINTLYEHLGGEKSLALPVFHSFTGCDTTSAYGQDKMSVWEAWNCFDDITQAFTYMALHPYAELNVTGFDKTRLTRTRTEIQFIA